MKRIAPVAGALVLLGAIGALLLYDGRGTTFWEDDWSFVLYRQGHSLGTFLTPHYEHLSLVPVVIYKALFKIAGLQQYWPYRLVLVLVVLATAVFAFLLMRRAAGDLVGLLFAIAVPLLGPGWIDLLWAFQVGFLMSLAAGVAALWLISRGGVGRRDDTLATLALTISAASASTGLCFVVGAAAWMATDRTLRRRWFVVAVPAGLYAIWKVAYRHAAPLSHSLVNPPVPFSNVWHTPAYVFNEASAAAGAITGIGYPAGRLLVTVGLAALVWRLWKGPRTPGLIGTTAAALFLWIATAIERAHIAVPETGRYLVPSALLLLLVLAHAVPWRQLDRRAQALVAIVVAFGLVNNIPALSHGGDALRANAAYTRADITALADTQIDLPQGWTPDLEHMPFLDDAHSLVTAIHNYGSATRSQRDLTGAPGLVRDNVDHMLGVLFGPHLAAAGAPRGTCSARAASAPAQLEVPLRPGATILIHPDTADAHVAARRFGDSFSIDFGAAARRGWTSLAFPSDAIKQPWIIRIASPGSARACVS